ncbi:MAG: LicD family protein [Clostridiales bacterium]|nr:LicD family protein [Clostridiales bacterium]
MNEIQQRLLSMLEWLHEFCEKHSVTYYAIGGTLLGAVRHKGFIPWDDDIDVGMPRKEYERFLELAKAEGGRYRAETVADGNKDFIYSFCKLYDTESTVVCNTKYRTKRGLFIDIFPLDGAGNTLEDGKKYYKSIEFKNRVISAKRGKLSKRKPFYQNASVFIAKFLPINWRKKLAKVHRECAAREYDTCEYVGNLFGHWHEREIVKREWMGEPKLYEFESIKICGPQDADSYLTSIYGDYMTPPPEEKRKPDHEALFMDLNKSYLED